MGERDLSSRQSGAGKPKASDATLKGRVGAARANQGIAAEGRIVAKRGSPVVVGAGRDSEASFDQVWEAMRKHLKANYPTLCRQWFDELIPLGIAGGALEMRTRSVLHRDYLRRQCAEAFNDAARTASGRLLSIRFLGPDDISEANAPGVIVGNAIGAGPTGAAPAAMVEAPGRGGSDQGDSRAHQLADQRADQRADQWGNQRVEAAREARHDARATGQTQLADRLVEPVLVPESSRPVEVVPPRRSAVTVHEPPPRYETLVVNPDYSFENFVVGPNNRLAHAAAKAVSDNPGRAYNPLFIHGGVGLGKTHVLQAICLKIVENNPSAVLYYTSCEGFVTQYLDSVAIGEMTQFRHRFRDVDVLIIDDIHFLTKRDRSQEEFFHTFNSLFQGQKQIILSSDAPPEEIPDLEERLVSRFKWGLVAHIAAPDYETRIEILKTKARLRGMALPDDVAAYIAQHIDKNIRELEGAITKLQLQAMVDNAPLSLELARRAIHEKPKVESHEPTIQGIISVVTDFYQIRLSDMQSKLRQRSIALPRHVCMYLARKCTRLSLEEIGGFFGGRDHTTVMHAVKTVEGKLAQDPEFVAVLNDLEQRARTPAV